MKRFLDIALSLVAVLALALPMAAIAGLVWLSSPGGVLYRQTRVGLHGKPFSILKFRTMRPSRDGPSITRSGDARITPVGAILRRLKLDELPQIYNVLLGDMSIVGPRPEVPKYVEMYTEEERAIVLSVRPGITDLAAIYFRDEEQILAAAGDDMERAYVNEIMPVKIRFYTQYASTRSNLGDMKIIFDTAKAVLLRSDRHVAREHQ